MTTINKKIRDESIYHSSLLSDYAAHLVKKSSRLMSISNKQLIAKLYVELDNIDRNNLQIKTLQAILKKEREIKGLRELIVNEISEFSRYEYDYRLSMMKKLVPEKVKNKYGLKDIKSDFLSSLVFKKPFQGRTIFDWVEKLEEDRITRVINTITRGHSNGDSNIKILDRLKGSKEKKFTDSALSSVTNNTSSIIKTFVSHTSSTVQSVFAQKNDKLIKCKQWISVLDNRTTPTCIIRDLRLYTLSNEPIGHSIPYGDGPGRIHFCCRSIETLILKSFDDLGIDDESESEREAMDGQVPANTSYLEWLCTQPQERQEQILGVERARMLKEGEIKPSQFFTKNGRFLTLSELKQLH
jgi:hypothetical protein